MARLLAAVALALFVLGAAADPAVLERRQGTASLANVTCARNSYTKAQVDAAVAEGCRLYAAGESLGSSRYPHKFNNYEGLVFAAAGPYQEFPLLQSGVYTGTPGADRVVFNPSYGGSCVYVGAMTHTGAASRNGFVECTESFVSSGTGPSTSGTVSRTSGTATATITTATTTTTTASGTARPNNENAAPGLAALGAGGGIVAGAMAGFLLL